MSWTVLPLPLYAFTACQRTTCNIQCHRDLDNKYLFTSRHELASQKPWIYSSIAVKLKMSQFSVSFGRLFFVSWMYLYFLLPQVSFSTSPSLPSWYLTFSSPLCLFFFRMVFYMLSVTCLPPCIGVTLLLWGWWSWALPQRIFIPFILWSSVVCNSCDTINIVNLYIYSYSYSTTNKMHLLSQIIYSCKTLYMFRTVFPSIIRSSKLRIQQRYTC